MNEVVSPFILLKSQCSISLSKLYNLFSAFLDTFLTNYYREEEFYSLQSSLGILKVLLKYHNPGLFNIFEYNVINPEMYATSWVLTVFAK